MCSIDVKTYGVNGYSHYHTTINIHMQLTHKAAFRPMLQNMQYVQASLYWSLLLQKHTHPHYHIE